MFLQKKFLLSIFSCKEYLFCFITINPIYFTNSITHFIYNNPCLRTFYLIFCCMFFALQMYNIFWYEKHFFDFFRFFFLCADTECKNSSSLHYFPPNHPEKAVSCRNFLIKMAEKPMPPTKKAKKLSTKKSWTKAPLEKNFCLFFSHCKKYLLSHIIINLFFCLQTQYTISRTPLLSKHFHQSLWGYVFRLQMYNIFFIQIIFWWIFFWGAKKVKSIIFAKIYFVNWKLKMKIISVCL